MSQYAEQKEPEKIVALYYHLLEQRKSMDIFALNKVLSALKAQQNYSEMLSVYDEIKRRNLNLTKYSVSLLMDAFDALGKPEEMSKLYKQVRDVIDVDTFIYNKLLTTFGKAGDFTQMIKWRDTMNANNKNPNRGTFHAIMRSYGHRGMIDEMLKSFENMTKVYQLFPNEVTYGIIIHSFGLAGDFDSMLKYFQQTKEKDLMITTHIFNVLMNGFGKANRIEDMLRVYDLMEQSGNKPNALTFKIVVSSFLKVRDISQVMHWCTKMKEMNLEPHPRLITSIFSSKFATPVQLLELSECLGMAPSLSMYNSVIHYFGRLGDTSQMEKWFEQMKTRNVSPNVTTFNVVMETFAKRGEIVPMMAFFDRMKEQGLEPDLDTFKALLEGFKNKRHLEQLQKCYEDMLKLKILPNVDIFCTMLSAYGRFVVLN